MRIRPLITILIVCLLLYGCSHWARAPGRLDARYIVQEAVKDYFFDARIWYLDVDLEKGAGGYRLSGETFFPQSVEAVLRRLKKAGFDNVEDHVVRLPDTTAGAGNYGIVAVHSVMGRKTPTRTRQEATELIYGDPVRIIRENGQFVQVQAPDGYLCYIPEASLVRMNLPQWNRHQSGPCAIFRESVQIDSLQRINLGSRLALLGEDQVLLPDGHPRSVPAGSYQRVDPAANPVRQQVLASAREYLGLPYVWGGRSDAGVDCSGLVHQCYAMNGIFLPRDSDEISNVGRLIGFPGWTEALLPGDILFFTGNRRLVTHTGIYAGDGQIIHSSGKGTRIESWDPEAHNYNASLRPRFIFARRILD